MKRARLESDAAFQLRKAAERGARIPGSRSAAGSGGIAPALATAPIELEKPTKPAESSAEFLNARDKWIRLANLAELILAAATLIYIRLRSAKTNSPASIYDNEEEFPREIDAQATAPRSRENFTRKKDTAKAHASFNFDGLKRLRETLRDISFRLHKRSFKVDIHGDAVWIRMVYARVGTQETTHTAKAELTILQDAMTMPRKAYRERLEKFLESNGFEL